MSSSENGWFRSLAGFFEDSSLGSVVQGFQDDIYTLSSYGNATDEGTKICIIFFLFFVLFSYPEAFTVNLLKINKNIKNNSEVFS